MDSITLKFPPISDISVYKTLKSKKNVKPLILLLIIQLLLQRVGDLLSLYGALMPHLPTVPTRTTRSGHVHVIAIAKEDKHLSDISGFTYLPVRCLGTVP